MTWIFLVDCHIKLYCTNWIRVILIGAIVILQFWKLPLLFSYFEICHYNSTYTWNLPLSTSLATLGPATVGYKISYGQKYPCGLLPPLGTDLHGRHGWSPLLLTPHWPPSTRPHPPPVGTPAGTLCCPCALWARPNSVLMKLPPFWENQSTVRLMTVFCTMQFATTKLRVASTGTGKAVAWVWDYAGAGDMSTT